MTNLGSRNKGTIFAVTRQLIRHDLKQLVKSGVERKLCWQVSVGIVHRGCAPEEQTVTKKWCSSPFTKRRTKKKTRDYNVKQSLLCRLSFWPNTISRSFLDPDLAACEFFFFFLFPKKKWRLRVNVFETSNETKRNAPEQLRGISTSDIQRTTGQPV